MSIASPQSLAAAELNVPDKRSSLEHSPRTVWTHGYPVFINHLLLDKKTSLQKEWSYKAKITIDASLVEENLTDFPIVIDQDILPLQMLDADGAMAAKPDGGDLRFSTDSRGRTPIPCEIVSFLLDNDPILSSAEIWVQLPHLDAISDTELYIWWGKSAASQPEPAEPLGSQDVWDNGYVGVYHLQDHYTGVTGEVFDSSPHGNHGTGRTSNSTDDVIGKIGMGQSWADVGDALIIPHSDSLVGMSELTVSFWVYRNSQGLSTSFGRYLWKDDGYKFNGYRQSGQEVALNSHHVGIYTPTGSPEYTDFNGHWFYFANSWDAASESNTLYVLRSNSSDDEVYALTPPDSIAGIGPSIGGTADIIIGNRNDWNRTIDGIIDEVRIQVQSRSAGWIKAEYKNIHHKDMFFKATGSIIPASR